MTLSSLSNFITTHLGRMKAWAACNSLDYMLSSPLHTCVHCISRIMDPSSCLHTKCTCTLWRPRGNIHWYRQLFDWFDTLLHYLFSIKNRLGFWSPNQNYWCLVSPPCFFPADHRDSTLWFENRPNERTESGCPRSWKIAGLGDFVKSALRGLYLNNRIIDIYEQVKFCHLNFIATGIVWKIKCMLNMCYVIAAMNLL